MLPPLVPPLPVPVDAVAAAGLLAPGEVAVKWGMFSGTGWRDPMLVTSEDLPALLRA